MCMSRADHLLRVWQSSRRRQGKNQVVFLRQTSTGSQIRTLSDLVPIPGRRNKAMHKVAGQRASWSSWSCALGFGASPTVRVNPGAHSWWYCSSLTAPVAGQLVCWAAFQGRCSATLARSSSSLLQNPSWWKCVRGVGAPWPTCSGHAVTCHDTLTVAARRDQRLPRRRQLALALALSSVLILARDWFAGQARSNPSTFCGFVGGIYCWAALVKRALESLTKRERRHVVQGYSNELLRQLAEGFGSVWWSFFSENRTRWKFSGRGRSCWPTSRMFPSSRVKKCGWLMKHGEWYSTRVTVDVCFLLNRSRVFPLRVLVGASLSCSRIYLSYQRTV